VLELCMARFESGEARGEIIGHARSVRQADHSVRFGLA
jgi:hypothetical protein